MKNSDPNQELINIFETQREKIQAAEQEIMPGIFCDIAGTLLTYNAKSRQTETNQDILNYLQAQKTAGTPVTLISVVENNALILGTGLEDEFGSVLGKAQFRNRTLEVLIDDSPTLSAQKTIDPDSAQDMADLKSETKRLNALNNNAVHGL